MKNQWLTCHAPSLIGFEVGQGFHPWQSTGISSYCWYDTGGYERWHIAVMEGPVDWDWTQWTRAFMSSCEMRTYHEDDPVNLGMPQFRSQSFRFEASEFRVESSCNLVRLFLFRHWEIRSWDKKKLISHWPEWRWPWWKGQVGKIPGGPQEC